jgi:FkbM family methyltransferase
MGYKGSLLSFANRLASVGFFFNPNLPTYFGGNWIWLSRKSWNTLFLRAEPHTTRAMKSNLKAGDTFWDIGANIGWYSLLASRIVGPDGRVFSFEPSPDAFNLLSANVRGLLYLRAMQCGVGNADTVAALAAQGAAGGASFVEEVTKLNQSFLPETPIRKVEVNIRRVDTLLKELEPPHLVKIDVEGFELEVLKGARELLSTTRPSLIIEIHPPQLKLSGGTEALLFELLSRHGYVWEIIHRDPNSLYSIIAKPAGVIDGRKSESPIPPRPRRLGDQ